MSCDYDVWCLDCEEGHGFSDANHQDKLMIGLSKLGRELGAFAPTMRKLRAIEGAYVEPSLPLQCDRLRVDFDWFEKHGHHRLICRDEYGRNIDECGDHFECPACKHYKTCRRTRGHKGEHGEGRDA